MMFHPRKKPRFTRTGKIAPLSDDEEENSTNLTPPDKFTSDIPSFESLLAIPQNFVLTHVRNPNEAVLMFEIGVLGTKLDGLVKFLVIQLQQEEVLERKWRSVCNSRDPLAAAYIPSLAQLNQTHLHHQTTLTAHFHECINALKVCKHSLMQYVEMNKSVAEELLAEGCAALAANKLTVGKTEEMLLNRIDGFLNGNPFVHASMSWDSLINEKSANNAPSLLHNPAAVKMQRDSEVLQTKPSAPGSTSTTHKKGGGGPSIANTTSTRDTKNVQEPPNTKNNTKPTAQDSIDATKTKTTSTTSTRKESEADAKNAEEAELENPDIDKGSPYLFEADEVNTGNQSSSSSSESSGGSNSANGHSSGESGSKNNNISKEIFTSSDGSNNNHETSTEATPDIILLDEGSSSTPQKQQNDALLPDMEVFYGSSQDKGEDDVQWQASQVLPDILSQTSTPINPSGHEHAS